MTWCLSFRSHIFHWVALLGSVLPAPQCSLTFWIFSRSGIWLLSTLYFPFLHRAEQNISLWYLLHQLPCLSPNLALVFLLWPNMDPLPGHSGFPGGEVCITKTLLFSQRCVVLCIFSSDSFQMYLFTISLRLTEWLCEWSYAVLRLHEYRSQCQLHLFHRVSIS